MLLITFVILPIMLYVVVGVNTNEMEVFSKSLHRSKRQLLYPNSTLLQFNVGIGFPSVVKHVNINYVFQANFQLPWNRTQIPVDILHANSGYTGTSRKKRDKEIEDQDDTYQDEAKLYHFYKHVEAVLDGFGYQGRHCVLQTLCQLGAEPLHTEDEEDLLHEMASFVLNPTNDALQLNDGDETYPYIKAYTDGQNNKDCSVSYKGCSIPLIDFFTRTHDLHNS